MTCDPWPFVWPCDPPAEVNPEQQQVAVAAAQQMLWSRTGRRLGLCTVTERYRPNVNSGGCGMPYMTDDLVWHNGGMGGASCCAIHLTHQPVYRVTEVQVNGRVINPSTYRVEGARLIRRDMCWPPGYECYDPPITVTYRWGIALTGPDPDDPSVEPAPLWGMAAAAMGEVTNEVLNAMCGRQCRLPQRATSITRAGVTVTMPDPAATLRERLLGLPLADSLIMATNPNRLETRSRVYSPDMAQRA